AAELDEQIAHYHKIAGERFDLGPARERAQALRQEAAALHTAIEGLRTHVAAGGPEPSSRAAINAALMAPGRATHPLNYTAAGPFGHDPALAVPPLPLLAEARRLVEAQPGSDAARFSAVALQRGLNQVAHGLDLAREVVAQALELVTAGQPK